jgi:hypothetical protein
MNTEDGPSLDEVTEGLKSRPIQQSAIRLRHSDMVLNELIHTPLLALP